MYFSLEDKDLKCCMQGQWPLLKEYLRNAVLIFVLLYATPTLAFAGLQVVQCLGYLEASSHVITVRTICAPRLVSPITVSAARYSRARQMPRFHVILTGIFLLVIAMCRTRTRSLRHVVPPNGFLAFDLWRVQDKLGS